MADLNYQVEIDIRSASRALDGLKNQILTFGSAVAGAFAFREISDVSSRFEDLRKTLQLLYKDSQLGSDAFDDIKKFAADSVFSVENLTETFVKLKAAGLTPTISQLRLFADVSSVAADSVGALQAITDLYSRTTAGGLGLEDLNRLADRGIPVFTILSERLGLSRLQISEVGKTAEGARIILRALEDGLNDSFGGASANRIGTVSQSFSALGDALANASDVLGQAGLNKGLSELATSFTRIVSAATPVIEVLGKILGGVLSILADNIGIVTALLAGLMAGFVTGRIIAVTTAILGAAKAMNLLGLVIGKSPIGLIARIFGAGAVAMGVFSENATDLSGEIDKLSGSTNQLNSSAGFKVLQEGKLGAGTENLRQAVLNANEALNKFKTEMGGVVTQFARYNAENVKSLTLETALIGTSKETQELRRAEAEINNRLTSEIARLTEQKAKLTEQERNEGRGAVIDATIKKLTEQAGVDRNATAAAIKNSEDRQRTRQLELFSISTIVDANRELASLQTNIATALLPQLQKRYIEIEAQAKATAQSAIAAEEARRGSALSEEERNKYLQAAAQRVRELQTAESDLAKVQQQRAVIDFGIEQQIAGQRSLREIQNEMATSILPARARIEQDLLFKAQERAKAEIDAENARRGRGNEMSASEEQAYYDAATNGVKGLTAATLEQYDQSRLFSTGWSRAFNEYTENATNAATQAQAIFATATKGMEDLIVNFAKTGKFEFKGFLSSVVEQILRSQVQKLIANTFGSIGGGGGSGSFLGSIGSMLGFANGGIIPTNAPVVVGERGPEIISGAAGRVVTPNEALGGSSNVTYNINAVDAQSFKQMIAADPSFIHAVAMQGGRGAPTRR